MEVVVVIVEGDERSSSSKSACCVGFLEVMEKEFFENFYENSGLMELIKGSDRIADGLRGRFVCCGCAVVRFMTFARVGP